MFQFILILKLSFKQKWLCCFIIVVLYKFDALKTFQFKIRKYDTGNFLGAGGEELIS